MAKITLNADNLTGFLNSDDKNKLNHLYDLYEQAMTFFKQLDHNKNDKHAQNAIVDLYTEMGRYMKQLTHDSGKIHVYPFETSEFNHGEASRTNRKTTGY